MDKQIENLTTVEYCIKKIEEKLAESDLENRWLWEVRLKIANYVLSYLSLNQKKNEIQPHTLSIQQIQDITNNHPLLQPFSQAG